MPGHNWHLGQKHHRMLYLYSPCYSPTSDDGDVPSSEGTKRWCWKVPSPLSSAQGTLSLSLAALSCQACCSLPLCQCPCRTRSSRALQGRPSVSHTRETIGNKSTLATLPCGVAHSVEGDRVVVRDRAPAPGKGCIPLWLALRLPSVCPQVASC